VKNVTAATVQRIPLAFSDDEMTDEPHQSGFFSCMYCALRFGVRAIYTSSSENEFVGVETFSDTVPKARETHFDSAIGTAADVGCSRAPTCKNEASTKFAEDLEGTVRKSGDPTKNLSLIANREEILENRDRTPSVAAYNESFGMSFRGEMLSVSSEVVNTVGGVPKFSLLWTTPEYVDETGRDVQKKRLRLPDKTFAAKKHTFSSF
jgi:hypothetical protein